MKSPQTACGKGSRPKFEDISISMKIYKVINGVETLYQVWKMGIDGKMRKVWQSEKSEPCSAPLRDLQGSFSPVRSEKRSEMKK